MSTVKRDIGPKSTAEHLSVRATLPEDPFEALEELLNDPEHGSPQEVVLDLMEAALDQIEKMLKAPEKDSEKAATL